MSALRLGPAASSACGFIGPFAPRCSIGQVCGQNPAYDFFPSQHQIFYRAKGKGQMWYDPVFKVVTVEGKEVRRALLSHEIVFRANASSNDRALLIRGICLFHGLHKVWRRRHYRVKTAAKPGTFRFSVLDNGVVSNEYWRIVDVADDLSWGEFPVADVVLLESGPECVGWCTSADSLWGSD